MVQQSELQKHIEMEEDELYFLLGKSSTTSTMFNEDALTIKGKRLFSQLREKISQSICPYQDESTDALVTATAIFPVLKGLTEELAFDVMPLVALLIKYGIKKFCIEQGYE